MLSCSLPYSQHPGDCLVSRSALRRCEDFSVELLPLTELDGDAGLSGAYDVLSASALGCELDQRALSR